MNTPGIFYPVIADDLGAQTAETSAWMAICLLSAAIFQPWLGNAVSRFHMRTLTMAGALTMAVVFLVFSVSTAPLMFWVVAVFTGLTFATCLSVGRQRLPTVGSTSASGRSSVCSRRARAWVAWCSCCLDRRLSIRWGGVWRI